MLAALTILVTLVASVGPVASASQPADVITLPRGSSEVLQLPANLERVAIGDPSVANAVVVTPREILVNGVAIGSTTLIVWNRDEVPRAYTIEVTADAGAIQRQFDSLFPGERIEVSAQGNVVVLSGFVSGGEVARRMVEIARASGATVIENFSCIRPSTVC